MLLFIIISLIVLLVPLWIMRICTRQKNITVKQMAIYLAVGAGGWLVAKIPKGLVVIPYMLLNDMSLQMDPAELEQLLSTDLTFLFMGAVVAGVFEELFKPAGLLFFREKITVENAAVIGLVVGIGAGWLEALNVIGGQFYSITALGKGSFLSSLHVPVERLLIIFFHGSMTALLVALVRNRKFLLGLSVPIVIHFALDYVMTYLQVRDLVEHIWLIQGLTAAWVIVSGLLAYLIIRYADDRNENGSFAA